MTPPPATAAAAGHQRAVRRGTTPRGPRRVSGPSRAAGGARANAATATAAAAAVNPNQLPFEVPVGRRAAVARPVGLPRNHNALVHRIGRVAEHTWLDRLLRSRAWIVVVGVGLIGLVFMQVSLLKLNSGMGRDVERATVLERENSLRQAEVSKLESNDRIQQEAVGMGMVPPTSDGVRYLGKGGKAVGGGTATQIPSQAEASQAVLPTAPADDTEHPTTATETPTVPQTTSSVPGAVAPVPQSTTVTSTGAATTAAPTTGTSGTGTDAATTTPPVSTAGVATGTGAATAVRSETEPSVSSATGGATPGA
jgi:hypothetical protein